MMKVSTNKRANAIYKRFYNSTIYSVLGAYKTGCSRLKQDAEINIKREMLERNGWSYKIIGANGFSFSCGYLYNDDAGNIILAYHTKSGCENILIDADINGNII